MSLPKNHSFTFVVHGTELVATLSPCVWLYNLRLQYSVALNSSPQGKAIVRHPSLGLTDATEADALALCSGVNLQPCSRCGKPAFDPATVETNRHGLCEACFLDDLNAELEVAQRRERAAAARKDRAMRKKGYAWKVVAWVHPRAGDDRQLILYYAGARPSDGEISKQLKRSGSCILNDFTVNSL